MRLDGVVLLVQKQHPPEEQIDSLFDAFDNMQPVTDKDRTSKFVMGLAKDLHTAAMELNADNAVLSPRVFSLVVSDAEKYFNACPGATKQASLVFSQVSLVVSKFFHQGQNKDPAEGHSQL